MKRLLRIFLYFLLVLVLLLGGYFIYMQRLVHVHPKTIEYNAALRTALVEEGYAANYVITSTVRPKWFNDLLVRYGGAATKSQHLKATAIDIAVLDVNADGRANAEDVDIVYDILNKKVIGNKGGIGTYKNGTNFLDRQMVHFDSRGHRARWHR